jgi:cytochrome P450
MAINLLTVQLLVWLTSVSVIYKLMVGVWNIKIQASKLSAIPNAHFSAPYSRLWLFFLKVTDSEHRAREVAHRNLGPVIRLAPNELSVNCIGGGVQTIYSREFEKGEWYDGFVNYGYVQGSVEEFPELISSRKKPMFAMGPNKEHAERRKLVFHMFSNSYIQTSTEVTNILDTMLYERFIPQMRVWARNQATVDINRENKAFMMDVASAFLFGLGNGTNFLLEPAEKAMLTRFEQSISAFFWILEIPSLVKWCGLLRIPPLSNQVQKSLQAIEDMVTGIAARTKEDILAAKETHTSLYAHMREKLAPSFPPESADLDKIVASEMMDNLFAGHEGAAVTVTFLMCELSRNHKATTHLHQELATFQTHPTAHDIETLPFLNAILLETLRVYPAAYGPFTRDVPAKGADIGGFHIPGGTAVNASVYCLHHNEAVFPNPDRWVPERWITASVEERKVMGKWLWTFGSGSRMCIGNHLAIRSMSIPLAAQSNNG